MPIAYYPPRGLEPISTSPDSASKLGQSASSSGAKSGALSSDLPPDLALVVNAWARLPENVKTAILDVVKAATELDSD